MILVQFIYILCFCLYLVTGQACDTSSNTPQCSAGERCSNNTCEAAISCPRRRGCSTGDGLYCRSDYCQPSRCNSTGQCVHGQVCQHENYSGRSCVYFELLDAAEGSNVTLNFTEPSTHDTFNILHIKWYREGRSEIANFDIIINPGPKYDIFRHFGRDKAKVNTTTGAVTLINVTVEEEGFYYYEIRNFPTIPKHEYRLKLNVTPSVTIQGVSDKPVEVGTKVTLTCTPVKVNTRFTKIYWVVDGRNESRTNTRGKGLLTISLVHVVTKEDKWNPITCVVVPRFTDVITVEKTINPGYAPTGKPVIQASTMSQYKGEKVTLTCENPEAAGNPPCNAYYWIKLGINFTRETQIYTFIMDEFHAGNYSCRCRNVFGESEISDVVEIMYLGERPEISSKDNRGLIAGCVIGVLVLVALVIVVVFVCKKYNINLNIQTKSHHGTKNAGGKKTEAYEIPVSNLKPSNTDNNNIYEEPINRPMSEMGNYEDINEDEMDKGGEVGYINMAFPTYEDIDPQVGNTNSQNTDRSTSII